MVERQTMSRFAARSLFIFVTFFCRLLTFFFSSSFISCSFHTFCCFTILNSFTTIASLPFCYTVGLSLYYLFYYPIVNAFHWYGSCCVAERRQCKVENINKKTTKICKTYPIIQNATFFTQPRRNWNKGPACNFHGVHKSE